MGKSRHTVKRFDDAAMAPVKRFDFGTLDKVDAVDDAGMLRASARLTRVGVFPYRQMDGSTRRELRHPDEVFAADSLSTLAQVPVTLGHPADMLTADTAKACSVGATGERIDVEAGQFVRGRVVVFDAQAVQAIQRGDARQVSCGYTCTLDFTPGEWQGERYDAVQRGIRYNHAALVMAGRAGPQVRVMDGAQQVAHFDNGGSTMAKITIDGVQYELADTVAGVVQGKLDKLAADAQAATKRADEAQAKLDAAPKADQIRADALADFRSRAALDSQAIGVLGAEAVAKLDAAPADDLRRAVIAKLDPTAKLDGKSADYIAARFDAAMEAHTANVARQRKTGAALVAGATGGDVKQDAADDTGWQAAQKAVADRLAKAGTADSW